MRYLLIAATIGLLANVSHASLIGDTVTIEAFSPNQGIDGTLSTMVTSDATDRVVFNGELGVDPFDSGFVVDHIPTNFAVFYFTGSFLEFTDLDWLPTAGEIIGVSITNNSGLTINADFTADSARVDFEGDFSSGEDFTVNLQTRHGNAVPEPSTFLVWGLLGLTLGGGYWWRRKK